MKPLRSVTLAAIALVLTACQTEAPPGETLFVPQNAYTGSTTNAQDVDSDEFRRRINARELTLVSDASLLAQRAEREESYQDELTFLKSLPEKDPNLQQLIAQAEQNPGLQPDPTVNLQNGQQVVLLGLESQVRHAAGRYRLAQSVENALADYRLSYNLLPDELRPQAAPPSSLTGKRLEEIQAALQKLNDLLGSDPSSLHVARLEPGGGRAPGSPLEPGLQSLTPVAGNGRDEDSSCNAPTNYVKRYWFPLKNFVSPIKNQGNRGTCWAFTAIGALESRERVRNNLHTNLSEQFLVNKYKREYDQDDFTDGGSADWALEQLISRSQTLPQEGFWTYNPSLTRSGTSQVLSCTQYTGTCSASTHQSKQICTQFLDTTYCAYETMDFPANNGPTASKAVQIWANGQPFDLYRYITYLNRGHTLMVVMPIYPGFDGVTNSGPRAGVVTDYSQTNSRGNHLVQIVGFLSNWDLRGEAATANVGGGGYFIVKNSWGCSAADGGYYYVPADYVQQAFLSLSVLEFDIQRSDAWNYEQANPGTGEAPFIQILENPVRTVQNQLTNLSPFFQVIARFASSVELSITSSADGVIYRGPWSTSGPSPALDYTFTSAGSRRLNILATLNGLVALGSLTVLVDSPPTNPYPIITSAAVLSRNTLYIGGIPAGCGNYAMANGSSLDLRDSGCQIIPMGDPPTRYFGSVTVDNPSKEALSYDWVLYHTNSLGESVLYQSQLTGPTFDLPPYGNTVLVTEPCRVVVRVNAPEATRSKTRTVWSGQCTFYAIQLR